MKNLNLTLSENIVLTEASYKIPVQPAEPIHGLEPYRPHGQTKTDRLSFAIIFSLLILSGDNVISCIVSIVACEFANYNINYYHFYYYYQLL